MEDLLRTGEAAWCPIVRLELWAGVGSDGDRKLLRDYQARLPELAMTAEVWNAACELGDRCRRAGKTIPLEDVAIAACARLHDVELEHDDRHFDELARLFSGLRAAP